jgi:hypothetical protein
VTVPASVNVVIVYYDLFLNVVKRFIRSSMVRVARLVLIVDECLEEVKYLNADASSDTEETICVAIEFAARFIEKFAKREPIAHGDLVSYNGVMSVVDMTSPKTVFRAMRRCCPSCPCGNYHVPEVVAEIIPNVCEFYRAYFDMGFLGAVDVVSPIKDSEFLIWRASTKALEICPSVFLRDYGY